MPTRFYCDIEGFRDNWVEVDDYWTRAELREVYAVAEIEEYLSWFQRKVTACHLQVGPAWLDAPADVTDGATADMDLRLWGFVVGVLMRAGDHLRGLGNFSARLSSNGAVKTS